MAWHYAPCINLQAFICLAILPAFDQFVFVLIPGKYIYPIHCCKTDKIKPLAIPKFVFSAHNGDYSICRSFIKENLLVLVEPGTSGRLRQVFLYA